MRQKTTYEQDISLRDILFHVLYHWRSILVVSLCAAVLVAGYRYLSISAGNEQESWNSKITEYQENQNLYDISRKNLETAMEASAKQIDILKAYQADSLLMSINPQAEWYGVRQYSIRKNTDDSSAADGMNTNEALLTYYSGLINHGLDAEKLKQLTGTEQEQYARELIAAGPGIPLFFSGLAASYAQEIAEPGRAFEDSIFTVEVRAGSEKTVHDVMGYLTETIEEGKEKAQEIAAHELVLLSEDVQVRVDGWLKYVQEELALKIRELQAGIQTDQKALTGLVGPTKPTRARVTAKSLIKYAAIGALLGAIALAGFYMLVYIFSGRLHLSEEITKNYSVPVYGEFPHSRARRPRKGLDALIEKWEFRNTTRDEAVIYGNIGALIRENCPDQDILITGTVSREKIEQVQKRLETLINADRLTAYPDFIHNAEAISASKDAPRVLLVEEKQASRVKDIDREAEILDINGTRVAGYILL